MPQVADIPFAMVGQGQQAAIKVVLAMDRASTSTAFALIEEPENHLSYTGLTRLVARIETLAGDRQVFVTTHSSFLPNRLGLDKLVLISDGHCASFGDLPADTVTYFKTPSGYYTMRLVLAQKAVLVEGPSDEMVFERAFRDHNGGRRPMELGVDVISMSGVSLKRGLQLCAALKRQVPPSATTTASRRSTGGRRCSHGSKAASERSSSDRPNTATPSSRIRRRQRRAGTPKPARSARRQGHGRVDGVKQDRNGPRNSTSRGSTRPTRRTSSRRSSSSHEPSDACRGRRTEDPVVRRRVLRHGEPERRLVLTYTISAQHDVEARLRRACSTEQLPDVSGWYTFLLHHWVRPYLPLLYPGRRLTGLNFDERTGVDYATGESRYLDSESRAYKRYLSKLALDVAAASDGAVIDRLEHIYDEIHTTRCRISPATTSTSFKRSWHRRSTSGSSAMSGSQRSTPTPRIRGTSSTGTSRCSTGSRFNSPKAASR